MLALPAGGTLGKLSQFLVTKGPFGRRQLAAGSGGIPGIVPRARVVENVNFLRGHVALGQEKQTLTFGARSHIHHKDRVAGETAVNEDISDLHRRRVRHRLELPGKRGRACIGEYRVEILTKIRIARIGLRRPTPGDEILLHNGTHSCRPVSPSCRIAAGESERDRVFVAAGIQIFSAQPDHRIGALLKVLVTHIHIEHGDVCFLVRFETTIVQMHGLAPATQWKTSKPGAEARSFPRSASEACRRLEDFLHRTLDGSFVPAIELVWFRPAGAVKQAEERDESLEPHTRSHRIVCRTKQS